MNTNDITGKRFGSLEVIGRDFSYKSPKRTKWICRCDCGTTKSIYRDALIQGKTHSCGCKQYAGKKGINSTHGMSGTRIYHTWVSMRKRCSSNASSKDTKGYYNRGIKVCSEWSSFEKFYDWAMANGYDDTLTIDRIDNDGDYTPDNCRWVSLEEQQSNKTTTTYILYNGEEQCLHKVCVQIGFPYKTAHKRLQRMKAKGVPIDVDKLFEPIHKEKIAKAYR